MRFWDASALVPLSVVEPTSKRCRQLLRTDPGVAVWYGTRVEVMSALFRQRRDELLTADELAKARRRTEKLFEHWTILEPGDELEHEALAMVERHPLRAGDAFQLGAARLFAKRQPRGKQFVCRDGALSKAAEREGFDVIVPGE